jgi:16S rRNA processing protein RimM
LDPNDWVVLGRIERSRGLRGEVVVSSPAGGPESFQDRLVTLRKDNLAERQVLVDEAWPQGGRFVLKLKGVDSIEAADALRGVEICVRVSERLPLGEGEYYLSDLVGCQLFDEDKLVGPVTGWHEFPGSVLLTVQNGNREALVPFVRAICTDVDLAGRRILAKLPSGLLDL